MKRILGIILSVCMLAGCLCMFTSCSKEPTATGRMTVDINPSVEFMLDKDNKVISATALNDDGEVILYGEAFVGKTAEEAAKMVVEIANETGYLVKGEATATKDEIKISISSDTANIEALYEKVQNKVKDFVEKNGIDAQIKKGEALALDALRKYVVANTEYTEDDVKDMTATQLYAALGATRLDQAGLYSEALRNAYTTAKNYDFKFAEKEETAKVIEAMGSAAQFIYSTYQEALAAYKNAIKAVEDARFEYLVSADSEYQKTLAKLRAAKEDFIIQKKLVASLNVNDANYSAQLEIYINLQDAYEAILKAYEACGDAANKTIDGLVKVMQTGYDALANAEKLFPTNVKEQLTAKAKDIENAANKAKDDAFASFEKAHKADIEAAEKSVKEYKQKLKDIAAGREVK